MRRKALLKSLINRWREIFFQLSVAKELVGYPLYFTSYVDYRGRLYPNESCFGRTQGVLKHLVSGVEKFIELPAFLFFFEAYYASLPETDLKALLSQLKDILSLGLGREETLKSFLYVFNQNPLHLDVRKHPYHTLVGIELGKALRCGSSGFLLQLDQRSSGPALLGLLLGHKGLSDRAVFNTDAREYLVPFLQGHLHEWFRLARISPNGEGKSLFELFLVDKRFVKGCVMQLIYGQKGYGRWVFLKDLAIQVDSGYAHSKFFEMFRKLGFSFERLIDEVLPGLRSKISSLESICRIFAGSLKNFTIRLPDGTFISYRCVKYSHPSVNYGSKDPITGNVVRHRISFNEIKCIDKEASLRAAIPNLVQALDAWILREALYSLGKKGVTFNHVHDAFLLHCGDIDMFFSIIKDIYRKKFFKASMDYIYISPNCDQLEQLVTKDVLDDISYYRDRVLSREPILYSAFDPSNCYKFK